MGAMIGVDIVVNLLPVEQEKEGVFDLLVALILCVIAVVSLFHAGLRMVFAVLGLVLWSLALLTVFLYWLRSWAVARSSSSLRAER
jgi:hypothetical protein